MFQDNSLENGKYYDIIHIKWKIKGENALFKKKREFKGKKKAVDNSERDFQIFALASVLFLMVHTIFSVIYVEQMKLDLKVEAKDITRADVKLPFTLYEKIDHVSLESKVSSMEEIDTEGKTNGSNISTILPKGKYIVVTIEMKNKTNVRYNNKDEMYYLMLGNKKIPVDAELTMYLPENPMMFGDIQPKKKIKGKMVFDITNESTLDNEVELFIRTENKNDMTAHIIR